jgi:phosphate-selective porin OprO/OprP
MARLAVPWGSNRRFLLSVLLTLSSAASAIAQTPPVPEPSVPPPAAGEAAPPTAREAALEARIQQLEAMMQQMSAQISQGTAGPGGTGSSNSPYNRTNATNTVPAGAGPGGNSPTAAPSALGPLSPGQSSPPNPPPSGRFNMPATTINKPLTGIFGPGFQWKTDDDEFVLQFHDLTQIEYRGYQQGGQNPTHDTFTIPRQWWMFSGRITKPWEYFLSFQEGFDVVNGLDIFLNAHYDDRVQLKVGRFKTPFTYEFYTEPIQGLINPERSLFFNNFALNRSVGGMIWGRLFNTTVPLDYAVGMFNSSRNSFVDTSDAKNVLAYLNWRPFALLEGSALENFVFGGSVMAGDQTSLPMPATFRTVVATAGNAVNGVPFLSFNANARESGSRAFWDLHAAWYYKQLSLIAEWQSGYNDYALTTNLAAHNRIGVESYYVQAGYFITGETVSGRNVVKPLRDFDIRKGKFGPGAIELAARFNSLNLTKNIFSSGLADGNLWTNNLYTTDLGFNWYINQYIKVYFTWQHAVFGDPVQYNANANAMQKTSDLFLLRFQLYF